MFATYDTMTHVQVIPPSSGLLRLVVILASAESSNWPRNVWERLTAKSMELLSLAGPLLFGLGILFVLIVAVLMVLVPGMRIVRLIKRGSP